MPFKPHDAQVHDSYHIQGDDNLSDMSDRIKSILDAKYEAADLDEVVQSAGQNCPMTSSGNFANYSEQYEELFDGSLGKWNGTPVELKLKSDARTI